MFGITMKAKDKFVIRVTVMKFVTKNSKYEVHKEIT
jgi:hypothetical protein